MITPNTLTKRAGLLALLSCVFLATPDASAREYRITLGGGGTAIADNGLLAVTDSTWLAGADLGFMVEIGGGALLGARIRGASGASDFNTASQDQSALVGVLDLMAVGRFHHEVTRWFRPFVEVEGGATQGAVTFERADKSDEVWGGMVAGTAGVEFRLPPGLLFGGEFSIGLDLAGGYIWRSTFDFDDVGGVDLGSLDLKGPYFRVAVSAMW
ncbi:MAG: hypothetical protein ACI9WU_004319 [Myxococcota bacterium]|jgi:hypothetical protein